MKDLARKFPGNQPSSNCRFSKRPVISRPVSKPRSGRLRCLSFLLFYCVIFSSSAPAAVDSTGAEPTHSEFLRHSLTSLVNEIENEFGLGARVRFYPRHPDSTNHWLDAAFAVAPTDADTDPFLCRYALRKWHFFLARKTRRSPFGRYWVERRLDVGLSIHVPSLPDMPNGEWRSIARTYTDWIPAARLAILNDGLFDLGPVPPAEDFVSRWVAPVGVGVFLGTLTYLFFSVR